MVQEIRNVFLDAMTSSLYDFRLNDAIRQVDTTQNDGFMNDSHPVMARQEQSRQMYSGSSQGKPQSSQMQKVDENLGNLLVYASNSCSIQLLKNC